MTKPLDAAGRYIEWDLPVIPLCSPDHAGMSDYHRQRCASPGKAPGLKLWTARGVPTAAEVAQWKADWPDANLGLVLGKRSRLVAVDVSGDWGEARLKELAAGELPETWEFLTGRGRRLLYRIPPAVDHALVKLGEAGPGDHEEIELLGDGQQTVVPPSVHPNGTVYAWVRGRTPLDMKPAPAPAWIVERMTPPKRTAAEGQPGTRSASERFLLDLVRRAIKDAPQKGRNRSGFDLACQLRDNGCREDDAWPWMEAYATGVAHLRRDHPYDPGEAQRSLEQAYSQPPRSPSFRQNLLRVGQKAQASLPLPEIEALRVTRTDPPIYTATIDGHSLRLTGEQLGKFVHFKLRCMMELNFIPQLPRRRDEEGRAYPSQIVWETIVNRAFETLVEENDVPYDASAAGAVWDGVCGFLTGEVASPDRQNVATGSVCYEAENDLYLFRSRDLRLSLQLHGLNLLDGNNLWMLLRDHGARDDRIWTSGRRTRIWTLPGDQVRGEAIEAPPAESGDDP